MTQSQIAIIIGCIVVCFLLFKIIRGVIKFAIIGCLVVASIYLYSNASPQQIDTLKAFAQNGMQVTQDIKDLASNSKSVRLSDSKDLQINIGQDNWVNVKDIASIKKVDGGAYSISVGDKKIVISDADILKVLDIATKQSNIK